MHDCCFSSECEMFLFPCRFLLSCGWIILTFHVQCSLSLTINFGHNCVARMISTKNAYACVCVCVFLLVAAQKLHLMFPQWVDGPACGGHLWCVLYHFCFMANHFVTTVNLFLFSVSLSLSFIYTRCHTLWIMYIVQAINRPSHIRWKQTKFIQILDSSRLSVARDPGWILQYILTTLPKSFSD